MTKPARNEAQVALRRLLPAGAPALTPDELAGELEPWRKARAERPFVAVNMIQTADGCASLDGRTAPISSVADRQLFHALRTRFDAVMVGAGTARVERYGRLVPDAARREQRVAAGLRPDPLAVIVSGSLDLPADLPLLQDADSRVVVVTASSSSLEGVRADVAYVRVAPHELAAALGALRAEHAVRAILCEGGPRLNASLIVEGLLDELLLTTAPLLAAGEGALTIVGDAARGGRAGLSLRSLAELDGELFARYALDG